jgi:hypothetical protein
MTDECISPLRRRMIEDMTVRNFVVKTQTDHGKAAREIVPPRLRIPYWKGPWCRFRREERPRERHRHCDCGKSECA